MRSLSGYSARRKADGSAPNSRYRSSVLHGASQILSPHARSRKRTPRDHTSFAPGEYGYFVVESLSQ